MKIFSSLLKVVLVSAFFLQIAVSSAYAEERVVRFEFPSIKDSFCGSIMDYRYCKCAFHNKFCNDIGMTRSSSNGYVWSEYREWVRGLINDMGERCVAGDDIWKTSNRSCTKCLGEHIKKGNVCVKQDDEEEEDDESKLPDGPFNKDCSTNSEFEEDWIKYSDFDDRIEAGSQSYEAQQYSATINKIIENSLQIYNYQIEMEVDRVLRLEMRNIKQALVMNIKTNLLKSFWRLSYVTFTTIKSGSGTAETYRGFLSSDNVVGGLVKGIKFIQANVPNSSYLVTDTKTTGGKIRSIKDNALLEALDNLDDPTAVVLKVVQDSVKASVPNPDITPEEIEILRTQYVGNKEIDIKIQESYLINSQRRTNILELQAENAVLELEAEGWVQKEKARVKNSLENNCKDQMKKD